MKLYDYPAAPSARRVRLLLAEKGVELASETIDLRAEEQFSDEFRAINPLCTVPALQLDDGTVLTQVPAIFEYLEGEFPDPPMLGRTNLERALVREWSHRCFCDGLMAIAEILRNQNPAFADRAMPGPLDLPQIPALAERGARRLSEFYDALEQRLEGREFLACDSYSVADSDAFVVCDFAGIVGRQPPEDHANLQRWRRTIATRPGVEL